MPDETGESQILMIVQEPLLKSQVIEGTLQDQVLK